MESEVDQKMLHDEMKLLYTASVGEIGAFKTQQWQVTNYAIAIYAVAVTLARTSKLSDPAYVTLILLIFGAWFGGLYWSNLLTESIKARRRRMEHIRDKYFTEQFRTARLAGEAENSSLNWFFYVVLTVGWLMALCFVHVPVLRAIAPH